LSSSGISRFTVKPKLTAVPLKDLEKKIPVAPKAGPP